MHNAWKDDLSWSTKVFVGEVWPAVAPFIGGGDVWSVEAQQDEMRRRLDMSAGIDYWQIRPDERISSIASRVQLVPAYNSFSVRRERDSGAETEWHKRRAAVNNGVVLYPHYTIQAFVHSIHGGLASAAVARTVDIIRFIERCSAVTKRCDNASFWACNWEIMHDMGYDVKTWSEDNADK